MWRKCSEWLHRPTVLTPLQRAPQASLEASLSIMYRRVLVCQRPWRIPHRPLFHDPLHVKERASGWRFGGGGKLVPYFLSFRYCFSCACTLLQALLKPLPRRSLPVFAKSAFFIFDRTATLRFCEIVAKVCPANWNELWIIVRRPAIFT